MERRQQQVRHQTDHRRQAPHRMPAPAPALHRSRQLHQMVRPRGHRSSVSQEPHRSQRLGLPLVQLRRRAPAHRMGRLHRTSKKAETWGTVRRGAAATRLCKRACVVNGHGGEKRHEKGERDFVGFRRDVPHAHDDRRDSILADARRRPPRCSTPAVPCRAGGAHSCGWLKPLCAWRH